MGFLIMIVSIVYNPILPFVIVRPGHGFTPVWKGYDPSCARVLESDIRALV
jgi:hypothetical protein